MGRQKGRRKRREVERGCQGSGQVGMKKDCGLCDKEAQLQCIGQDRTENCVKRKMGGAKRIRGIVDRKTNAEN